MATEEVIEKARLAFIEAWERKAAEQEETRRIPGERSRAGIEAAFTVFRQGEPSDAQVQALKVLEEAEPLAEVFGNSTTFGRAVIALRRLADERAAEGM